MHKFRKLIIGIIFTLYLSTANSGSVDAKLLDLVPSFTVAAQTTTPLPTLTTPTPQTQPTATPTPSPSITVAPSGTTTPTPTPTRTVTPTPLVVISVTPSVPPTLPVGGNDPTSTPEPKPTLTNTPTPTESPEVAGVGEEGVPPPQTPAERVADELMDIVETPVRETVSRAAATIEPITRPFSKEYYSPSGLPQMAAQGIVGVSVLFVVVGTFLLKRKIFRSLISLYQAFTKRESLEDMKIRKINVEHDAQYV